MNDKDAALRGADHPPPRALVIVCPEVAAFCGSAMALSRAWSAIDDWNGPVYVLGDATMPPRDDPSANTYLAIIDTLIDERESIGLPCRFDIPTEGPSTSVVDLLAAAPVGTAFTLTGGDRMGRIGAVARLIELAGHEARVDEDTLISCEEEDGEDPPDGRSAVPLYPP